MLKKIELNLLLQEEVVRVSVVVKETIILEGYTEGICIANLKKFRQFVFECISSLINVLFGVFCFAFYLFSLGSFL